MKDHEIASTINQVRDIAVAYGRTQQVRERLAQVLRPALANGPRVGALAALQSLSSQLRGAGASLPTENLGTIESAMRMGLSIALALIESEIEAVSASLSDSRTPASPQEGSTS